MLQEMVSESNNGGKNMNTMKKMLLGVGLTAAVSGSAIADLGSSGGCGMLGTSMMSGSWGGGWFGGLWSLLLLLFGIGIVVLVWLGVIELYRRMSRRGKK